MLKAKDFVDFDAVERFTGSMAGDRLNIFADTVLVLQVELNELLADPLVVEAIKRRAAAADLPYHPSRFEELGSPNIESLTE